jgi:Na+-translocating ferredoxin:NAD+ oxidoreductase RnfG subunit
LTINIPFIAAATALLIGATIAKVFAIQPKKADKSQKGEILKQLLALSEHDNKNLTTASPARSPKALSNQGRRPVSSPRKTSAKIAQPVRAGK